MYRFVTYIYNTGRVTWCGQKVKSIEDDELAERLLASGHIVAYCESVEKFSQQMGIKVSDINDCGLGT